MRTCTPRTFAADTLLEVKSAVKLVPLLGVDSVFSASEEFDAPVTVSLYDFEAQLVGDVVSRPLTVTTPILYPGTEESYVVA
jgi:hypothetical protein